MKKFSLMFFILFQISSPDSFATSPPDIIITLAEFKRFNSEKEFIKHQGFDFDYNAIYHCDFLKRNGKSFVLKSRGRNSYIAMRNVLFFYNENKQSFNDNDSAGPGDFLTDVECLLFEYF